MKVCFENDKTNALSNSLSIIDEELLRYGLPTDVWFHVECVIAVTILLVMRLTFRQQAFVRACLSSPIGWPTSWGVGQASRCSCKRLGSVSESQ